MQKFIKNKFDEYFDDDIMEDFEKLHYTSLTTEIKKDDLKSDEEILKEIQEEKEEMEIRMNYLNEREKEIKNKKTNKNKNKK